MYFVLQIPLSRLLSNKFLHDPQFLVTTGLESTGIVKNITVIVGEHEFILDAVLATLVRESGTLEAQSDCH
jgi:hypothetical protein